MSQVVYENEAFEASPEDVAHLASILGNNVQRVGRNVRIVRVAGHLRLSSGRVLRIRSRKAGPASLLSWMAYADPKLSGMRSLGTLPDYGGSADFGNLVAPAFCLETWRAIQTSGLLRTYQRQRVRSAAIRGRIDFSRLARTGGDLSKTPCVVFSRLPRTPLNCFLSAAVLRLERDPELRRAAGSALAPLAALLGDVPPIVDPDLLSGKRELSRLEQPFEGSSALARLIIRSTGLQEGQDRESLSFLINLANLFEGAVARAFHDSPFEAVAKNPVRLYREHVGTLGTSHGMPMELDVFLPNVNGEAIVVDAKYKMSVASANLQQMVAYCWLTGARRAVLVFPSGHIADRRCFTIPAGNGSQEEIRVELAELELGARSVAGWHAAARHLVSQVTRHPLRTGEALPVEARLR